MPRDVLDSDGFLRERLWVDLPGFEDGLGEQVAVSALTEEERRNLEFFSKNGFLVIDLPMHPVIERDCINAYDLLWKTRPFDLMAAVPDENTGRPFPMSLHAEEQRRGPGTRILDAHSHVEGIKFLATDPTVFRYVELILGQVPIATQSLLFEYGSNQGIHRDPWFVVTDPPCNLLAVWIALEDVTADCGPLVYVPGSHRMPFYPLSTGDIILHDPSIDQEEKDRVYDHMRRNIAEHGLEAQQFLPRKGQALIWHGSLAHGGSPVKNPRMTRRSLVVHFDVRANRQHVGQRIRYPDGTISGARTDRVLHANGGCIFDNPLRTLKTLPGVRAAKGAG